MSGFAEEVFDKYPQLLTSLYDIRTYEMIKSKSDPLRRVLRKDTKRTKKLRRHKRLPYLRMNQFGNALFEALDHERNSLFTCPVCRNVLLTPVTVDCGHTFCAGCLEKTVNGKCFCCSAEIFAQKCTNVLLQDLVEKHAGRQSALGSELLETVSALGVEPRYRLRSRFAGLLPKNTNASVTDIVSRFLLPAKAAKHNHSENPSDFSAQGIAEMGKEYTRYFTHMDISSRETLFVDIKSKLTKVFLEANNIKAKALKSCWQHITKSDLECILCSRCFYDPVTTSCGHTFCRDCLVRVLDYGLACPLCVSPLTHSELSRGSTRVLEEAIKILFPLDYQERRMITLEEVHSLNGDSQQVPVFVCTNAFPGVACPLYVYEPHYRLLTRRCLQSGSRKFAMASKIDTKGRFSSYGTILEIKDAVLMKNGQYILTTVGHRRFKVISKGEQDGYDTASVQYIRDSAVTPEKLPELVALHQKVYLKAAKWVSSLTKQALAEAERLIGPMPCVEKDWPSLPDGPAWAWWLMPILPLCKQLQVGFLSTVSLEKRLRAIDKMLEHFKLRMKALEKEAMNCPDSVESLDSCGFSERPVDIAYRNH